eukprot:Lankesteria_metandrocarpae@DN9114_c0_g1_i1.p1
MVLGNDGIQRTSQSPNPLQQQDLSYCHHNPIISTQCGSAVTTAPTAQRSFGGILLWIAPLQVALAAVNRGKTMHTAGTDIVLRGEGCSQWRKCRLWNKVLDTTGSPATATATNAAAATTAAATTAAVEGECCRCLQFSPSADSQFGTVYNYNEVAYMLSNSLVGSVLDLWSGHSLTAKQIVNSVRRQSNNSHQKVRTTTVTQRLRKRCRTCMELHTSRVQHCDHSTVQHCDHSTVQHCDHSRVQHCDHSTVQHCDHSTVQHCDHSTVQHCDHSTVQHCDHSTVQHCDHSTVQHCDHS